jgi:hypothetical protein
VGALYTIGVATGVGVAVGLLAAVLFPRWPWVALPAAAVAVAIALAVESWPEAVGAGIGACAGALGATPVVIGALRRGGTRTGLAVIVALAALAVAALAFIPVVGYLLAVSVPWLGARLRSRMPERFAGLRTLARD